jgi:RNA polymerase sigma factor (sigma-70 family)
MLDEKLFESSRPDFSECIYIINQELSKRRVKWRLTAIAWMDFDDVCQKIRLHVFNKWSQWDNSRPLRPWLNTIITNQITNLVRNNYSSFSKPCSQCKYNQGGNLCELYSIQNSACSDYSKWELGKKSAYDIRMPISIHEKFNNPNVDDKQGSTMDIPESDSYIDYEFRIDKFHKSIKEKLSQVEWKVYRLLYIDNASEIQTAQEMGYKTSEKNRSPGYKQIKKIKNKIYKIAKNLVSEIL